VHGVEAREKRQVFLAGRKRRNAKIEVEENPVRIAVPDQAVGGRIVEAAQPRDVNAFRRERVVDQVAGPVLADRPDIGRLRAEATRMNRHVEAVSAWIHLVAGEIAINHIVAHRGNLDHGQSFGLRM
jgi:hypothetical protein